MHIREYSPTPTNKLGNIYFKSKFIVLDIIKLRSVCGMRPILSYSRKALIFSICDITAILFCFWKIKSTYQLPVWFFDVNPTAHHQISPVLNVRGFSVLCNLSLIIIHPLKFFLPYLSTITPFLIELFMGVISIPAIEKQPIPIAKFSISFLPKPSESKTPPPLPLPETNLPFYYSYARANIDRHDTMVGV